MPWKNGPEFWQFVFALISMMFATAVGMLTRVAKDVRDGARRAFWSRELWLDIPAVVATSLLAVMAAEHYELSLAAGTGLGTVMGWAGPNFLGEIVKQKIHDWGGSK